MPSTTNPLHKKKHIHIQGARTHNLKNINLCLPYNQLIVITGLSGSGKSSLAFNTLFAEGQRRYLESLSVYARQFLAKIPKPTVDYIQGILPSIGMQQKTHAHNPRSSVATITEIYPYLKLLYPRIGQTISPISGQIVKKHTVQDVLHYINQQPQGTKILIITPLIYQQQRPFKETLLTELRKGFTRLMYQNTVHLIQDLLDNPIEIPPNHKTYLIIDRLILNKEQTSDQNNNRLPDSIQAAFYEGKGTCIIHLPTQKTNQTFSNRFEADNIQFATPTTHFFDYNNPYGACENCGGLGKYIGIAPEKVIPKPDLSIAQGAVLPWQTPSMAHWKEQLIKKSHLSQLPIHTPYKKLTEQQTQILWQGDKNFKGINDFFKHLESKAYKIQYRVLLSRYRGSTSCTSCKGTGLRKETNYVKIAGKNLIDLLCMPINQLSQFFNNLTLTPPQQKITKTLIQEIKQKISYLEQVGLSYLTLHRRVNTLSGGEHQRIRLTRALGGTLVDVLYVLDEPTVGLHPRDTNRLINVLKSLKQAGNTVIVVEHEEAVIKAADRIIDIGPGAGATGGKIIFQGNPKKLLQATDSHTANYLNGTSSIPTPTHYRKSNLSITLQDCHANNLKNITVNIPLQQLNVITGVSGSGKSTLVQEVLYPALSHHLGIPTSTNPQLKSIHGDLDKIHHIQQIQQNALGISSRSNPATYTKAYDPIRHLFVAQTLATQRNYTPAFFSFNIPGGRCETCKGFGKTRVEMQFLADVHITCEHCKGKRFKKEILQVQIEGKNINDVLNMTVDQALDFFKHYPTITNKLQPLKEIGLSYVKLGQSSSTFSGGEAQRLKLAPYFTQDHTPEKPTLFIFDEPTTGLHFRDIHTLINALQKLVDRGHTVLLIEHNIDIIKCADWIIDIGPDAGEKGGQIIFTGTPKQMLQTKNNLTAQYLRQKINTP